MTIARRQPLLRKRAKPRSYKTPRCVSRGCRQPQEDLARCRKHRDHHLDDLWRTRVGEGCELLILHQQHGFPCRGPIQAGHGLDRDEKPVRWVLLNRFWSCSAANKWAYENKRRWFVYVRAALGANVYEHLETLADQKWQPDYPAIEAELLADTERRRNV